MGYIKKTLNRVNLHNICEFIMHGVDDSKAQSNTYEERLKEATASMYVRIENTITDDEERQDTINDFNYALTTYADTYTEIGMKIGARLLFDLIQSNNSV